MSDKHQKVVSAELAIDAYLVSLLEHVPEYVEAPLQEEQDFESEPPAPVQTPPSTAVIETDPPAIQAEERVVAPEAQTEQAQAEAPLNPLSVMPAWAQQEFQILSFRVEDMVLAVPLTSLLRTIKYDRKDTLVPGQPDWFIGLLDEHDSRIGVLDTGHLIFGKTRERQRDRAEHPFAQILITEDARWGLACDEVMDIKKIKPEQIRWRTLRDKRPWLVGTVIDELIAVIDINELIPCSKK